MVNVIPVLPLGFQIALGQFLFENGLKILGEDISSLCGKSPMSHDKSKEAACAVNDGIGTGEKQAPRLPWGERDAEMALLRAYSTSLGHWLRRLVHWSGRFRTILRLKGKMT